MSSWCQHHDWRPTAALSDGPAQPSKRPPLRASRLEQQSIAVSVPAATHHGAEQNGAPQSQQNCHQSPTHTDRRRSSDADGWAPHVVCREWHGHADAERALRATVTGQGAGLPQQRDQEVVDVPQPQIEEFSARHSPERIDGQLLTVALVCVMQEKIIDVWEALPTTSFQKRRAERTCWPFSSALDAARCQ